ncbi:MAG: polyphosphate polymerase domain-containing protein [Clostridia bacterium]
MANQKLVSGKPYRHELKYIITEGEHQMMATRLKACLKQDYYASRNGGEYDIRSLYFDDPFDSAVEEKVDGVDSRDKYRIRIYNLTDDVIKLERKHKEGQYIKKDSVTLSRGECDEILAGHYQILMRRQEPFAQYMYGVFTSQRIRPKVLVDYTREPFVFPYEDVRVTFDKNVRTAMRATDLFNPDLPTYPVWALRNCMILEIKFNASLPLYVQELVQVDAAQHTAASKYVFCRQYEF